MGRVFPDAPSRPPGTRERRASPAGALACSLLIGVALCALAGVRWNATPSLDPGFYRMVPARRLARGDLVLFCPAPAAAVEARARGYLRAGRCPGGVEPLGKPIAALPGERIEHRADAVLIGGESVPRSATLARDGAGRPLAHSPFGARRLSDGEVWVLSTRHPRSYDSRYFGPVARGRILARLVPVWTW